MEGMNAIFQGINALSAMESRQKQNQIADFQLQEAQRVNAEKAALSKNYDAMAQAFQQNGGNLDALAPMVKDRDSMKAFASFVQDYQMTQDGMKKGQDASMSRAMQNMKIMQGYVDKALSSEKGTEEWAANVQQAAAAAPFHAKVSNYDPQTDTWEAVDADPVTGWAGNGQRISSSEIMDVLKNVQKSTIKTKDGNFYNKAIQDAYIATEVDRKYQNPALMMDEKKHIILRNESGQTMTAVPQLSDNPANGYEYLVVDPQRGAVRVPNLESLMSAGWKPTTMEQMNKEKEFSLKEQGLGMEQQRIGVSMANLGESRRQHDYQRTRDARLEDNDAMRATNSVIDDIRSRQSQILRNYVEPPQLGPDATPEQWLAATMSTKKAGMDIMRQRAQAGDTTAKADLEALNQMDQTYNEFAGAREQRARKIAGLGMGQPQQQAPASATATQPKPAAPQVPQGAVQDASGQVYVPAREGEPGAKRAKNGNWYKLYQQ